MIYMSQKIKFLNLVSSNQYQKFSSARSQQQAGLIIRSTQNYMSSQIIREIHQLQVQPTQLEQSQNKTEQLAKELLAERVAVETKTVGMFANFFTIVSQKSEELYLNIIGDYRYKAKNEYKYGQKTKILNFLQSKVLTVIAQSDDKEKIKFADFDANFFAVLPTNFEKLRNKILKGKTNLEAAKQSLEILHNSKESLKVKYLNEQAFEFDRMKTNSLAWGLLFGAVVNTTLYRRGNTIRKVALFLTFGHLFGMTSHRFNIDRYFDSVYPVFREEAIEFTKQEKEQFKQWRPEGKALIED